jgi:hypothetical protein
MSGEQRTTIKTKPSPQGVISIPVTPFKADQFH